MEFKFDEPVKNCKTCGYCNNSVCKLGDDDPNRFCIEYHRWKPKEPEKSCDNCGNGPKMSAKCTITTCHESNDRPEPGYYENWKPKQKESEMKVTAEAKKLLGECRDYWMQKDGYLLHCFGETVETPIHGMVDCALCVKYLVGSDKDCAGCPISQKTGHTQCSGTPHRAWNNLVVVNHVAFPEIKVTGEHLDKHLAETDFLSSLFDECVVEEKTYSVGDAFKNDTVYYRLIRVGEGMKVVAAAISSDLTAAGPVEVGMFWRITEKELAQLFESVPHTPVTLKITKVENK